MAGGKRELNKLQKIVDSIIANRDAMTSLSDAALRNKTYEFRTDFLFFHLLLYLNEIK